MPFQGASQAQRTQSRLAGGDSLHFGAATANAPAPAPASWGAWLTQWIPAISSTSPVTPRTETRPHLGDNDNVLWTTNECAPYTKKGGLGEVSQTIPNAFSKYSNKDMRIIIPYEPENVEHDRKNPNNPFQKTNLTLRFAIAPGEAPLEFEVLQKFEPSVNPEDANAGKGNWVYAIKSPLWLGGASAQKKSGMPQQDTGGLSQYTYDGPQQKSLEKMLIFNRAIGMLTPYLSEDGPAIDAPLQAGEQPLKRFSGHVDCLIGNDWLTGPTLYQPEVQADKRIRKLFMVHNLGYDNIQGAGFIEHIGQPVPANLTKVTDNYSPMKQAIKAADGLIINRNYGMSTTLDKDVVALLKTHMDGGRVFDMHHGLAEDFTPMNNPALQENYASWQTKTTSALEAIINAPNAAKRAEIKKNTLDNISKSAPHLENLTERLNHALLIAMIEKATTNPATGQLTPEAKAELLQTPEIVQLVPNEQEREAWLDDMTPRVKAAAIAPIFPERAYQFEELQSDTPEDWAQFKAANKKALQVKYGLKVDPNAVIISWAARLDPYQKGFLMVQNTLEKLLKEHPKLQVVIAGPTDDPSITAWIKRLNANPDYQGRFYMPNKFVDKTAIVQMNAGSDFVMLPSLYEPYGLTQLEAMKMGSIPIVHGVDGLRTTVSDPMVNGKDFIGRSKTGKTDIKNKDELAWFPDDASEQEWQTGVLMRPMKATQDPGGADEHPWAPEPEFTQPWKPGLNPKNRFAINVPGYRASLDYELVMRLLEKDVWDEEGHRQYRPDKTKKDEEGKFRSNAKRMAELIQKALEEDEKRAAQLAAFKKNPPSSKDGKAPKAPPPPVFKKNEIKRLKTLADRLGGVMPQMTFDTKQELFDEILRLHLVDSTAKPAEASFADAINRAVQLPSAERAAMMANAVRYVNTRHSWGEIVQQRYLPAIDSKDPFKAPPLQFRNPLDPSYTKLVKPADIQSRDNFPAPNLNTPAPANTFYQQVMDWFQFLMSPTAWWHAFLLRYY